MTYGFIVLRGQVATCPYTLTGHKSIHLIMMSLENHQMTVFQELL